MRLSAKRLALIKKTGWTKWQEDCEPIKVYEETYNEKIVQVVVFPLKYADGYNHFQKTLNLYV